VKAVLCSRSTRTTCCVRAYHTRLPNRAKGRISFDAIEIDSLFNEQIVKELGVVIVSCEPEHVHVVDQLPEIPRHIRCAACVVAFFHNLHDRAPGPPVKSGTLFPR
jgi:hypothetical protein